MKKHFTLLFTSLILIVLISVVFLLFTKTFEDCDQCVIEQGYEKTWDKVYYHPKGGFDSSTIIVNEADLSTFQVIDRVYAKDKNYFFREGIPMKNIDITTVEILDYPYLKDKNHVYYYKEIISEADVKSFQTIRPHFGKDENHIFQGNEVLKADPSTFEFISPSYAKDKNSVFYFSPLNRKYDRKIEEADVHSFRILENNQYEAEDKNYFFLEGKVVYTKN